jgi:hypothetical protein
LSLMFDALPSVQRITLCEFKIPPTLGLGG